MLVSFGVAQVADAMIEAVRSTLFYSEFRIWIARMQAGKNRMTPASPKI